MDAETDIVILQRDTATTFQSVTINGKANALKAIGIGEDGKVAPVSVGEGMIGGNPTAAVGLAPVNGAAATFMRSDGAPALNQAISPVWTGEHEFGQAVTVPDEAYDASGWDGNLTVPTKKAVRDKIEAMGGGSGDVSAPVAFADGNRLIRSDGPGKEVKDSAVSVDNSGNVALGVINAYDPVAWAASPRAVSEGAMRDKIEAMPGGDVSAPVAFADGNRLVRSAGPGKDVQDSVISVDNSGNVSGVGSMTVVSDAYNASTWNGNLTVPTKDAIRDKIESMVSAAGDTMGFKTGADQATTSGTAVNVTGMSWAVPAGETWSFEMCLMLKVSAAGANIKFALDIPASGTVGAQIRGSSGNAVITADATLSGGVMSSATGSATIAGIITTGDGGTIQLQFASGDGSATATVVSLGTYFKARKMA